MDLNFDNTFGLTTLKDDRDINFLVVISSYGITINSSNLDLTSLLTLVDNLDLNLLGSLTDGVV